jgi:outer membrane protein OmpA-like peptidoglycan-associated protein
MDLNRLRESAGSCEPPQNEFQTVQEANVNTGKTNPNLSCAAFQILMEDAMKSKCKSNLIGMLVSCSSVICFAAIATAQDQAPPQDQGIPASALTTKSAQAVGYEVDTGNTKVSLTATDLMPGASGEAKVQVKSKAGRANIDIDVKGLKPASSLGAEFLTYVLWVVTPEGRTGNTGELLLNKDGNGKLSATSPAQAFSLIVTAEPYFVVRVPSEMVVLQSEPQKGTKGKIYPVAEYKLMKRAQYEELGNPLSLTPDPKTPLSVYEARNAVEVAKSHQADKYAPEIFQKATASLQMTENAVNSKAENNTIIATARQTAQFAEDARALSVQRQEEERIKNEREAAAAKAKAEAEAKAAAEAAEAKQKADEAAAEAKRKADAEIAAQEAARKQAELEKQQLRERLLEQFNRVLPTTDTDRGLVVNMGDVLFATGKADLGSDAKIALAKLTGIVLNYPSLKLAIGGYTDSTGSEDFNQKLSQARADAVLSYLVDQGLDSSGLSSQGYGMSNPVADNSTPQGRQKNRRVEIVVSGEVIGKQIGGLPSGSGD